MSNKLSLMFTKTLDKHFGNKIKVIDEGNSTAQSEIKDSNSSSHATEILTDTYTDHRQNDISGIKVTNGEVVIDSQCLEDDTPLSIMSCDGVKLYINGELCEKNVKYNVTALDEFTTVCDRIPGSRNITITIAEDHMKAYADISYTPEYVYKLKDRNTKKDLKLNAVKEPGKFPPKYTVTEIMNEMGKSGIKYGIIKENILQASSCEGCDNLIIAKGTKAVDDKPAEVKILFDLGDKIHLDNDSMDKIDYKNVYSISSIEAGQVLAEIIPEEQGKDGKTIKGDVIKRKTFKNKPIKAGEGCMIEGNNVIATRSGRPSSKNGVLSVNNVFNIKDVDMKCGNINFVGDVEINGSVNEGMTVKAGNSIIIKKDVDNAYVTAEGEINISGNIMHSKIYTGQVNIEKKEYLDILNTYKDELIGLIESVKKLNESSDSTKKISDLTRILIENRYKDIPKLSLNIISRCIKLHDENDNELIEFLRSKVMGLNISNIKSIRDLDYLYELVEEEIDYYNDDMLIQSDIYVSYLQDSLVKSTGNIFVTGKGEYVTNLIALKNIEFLKSNSVARGGLISARGNIKLGTVGSTAGISTRIEVPKDGIITAEMAYSNTVFAFGKRSKTLDEDSKNLKAYTNKEGEIIIEKLKL